MTSILPPSASDPDDESYNGRGYPDSTDSHYAESPRAPRLPFVIIVSAAALVIIGTVLAVILASAAK